jgi:hypothetical protein
MTAELVMGLIFFSVVAIFFAALGLTYWLTKSQSTRDTIKDLLCSIQIWF